MPEKEFITGIPGVKVYDVYEGSSTIVVKGLAEIQRDTKCPGWSCDRYRTKASVERFLLSYGFAPNELNSRLSHRLTALMLLHRFSDLRIQLRIPDWEAKVGSMADLQNLAWGLIVS